MLRHEEKCRRLRSAGDRGGSAEFARELRTKQHHGRFVPGRQDAPPPALTAHRHRKFCSHYFGSNIISFLNLVVFTLCLISSFLYVSVWRRRRRRRRRGRRRRRRFLVEWAGNNFSTCQGTEATVTKIREQHVVVIQVLWLLHECHVM